MKNVFIVVVLVFFGCKKNNINSKVKINTNFIIGDSLISDVNFIKTIDSSCVRIKGVLADTKKDRDIFKNKCSFFKIKHNYFPYRGMNESKLIYEDNNKSYRISRVLKETRADDYNFVSLNLLVDNQKKDSLIIYNYENYIEALVSKGKYFYIQNNTIFIYSFNEDEEGIHSTKWSKYEIKDNNFKLIKNISF